MKRFLFCIGLLAVTSGCSTRAVYDNVRINQRNDCADQPPSVYFECLEHANKSYEEYERERKELLEIDTES